MIQHPLAQYSSQNPEHKPWAYGFTALTTYLAFFYKGARSIIGNPVSKDSFEKRYHAISSDFRNKRSFDDVIEQAQAKFEEYYRPENVSSPFYDEQEKSIPYFDLLLARDMAYQIYNNQSRYPDYYKPGKNEETYPSFPDNKSGQWLYKYLKRRYHGRTFAHEHQTFKAPEYWGLVTRQMDNDLYELNHHLQMISQPHMIQARSIDFSKGTIPSLIQKLQKVTEEISNRHLKKQRAGLIEKQSPSEIFLALSNGWKWVKIKDCYNNKRDDVEAQLMGHCATPELDDAYLISLRDKNNEPHVTATIKDLTEEMQILGQVKGRGNKKPSDKYKDQLLSLFLMPTIIKQQMSDNSDWTIEDFEDDEIQKIIKQKPYYRDANKLKDYFSIDTLAKAIRRKTKNSGRITVDKNNNIFYHYGTLAEYNRVNFASYDSRKSKYEYEWWAKYLIDQHFEVDATITNEEAAEWFIDEILKSKEGKTIYKAIAVEMEKNDQPFDDIDDYKANLKWAFHYGPDLSADLERAIYQSLSDSYSSSLLSQLEKYYTDFIQEVSDEMPRGFTLEFSDNGTDADVPIKKLYFNRDCNIYIKTSIVDLLSFWSLDDIYGDNFSENLEDTTRNLAHRYWKHINLDDYSSEYALDAFKDYHLGELLDKAKKILKGKK